jgi:hypothetical protein
MSDRREFLKFLAGSPLLLACPLWSAIIPFEPI